MNLRTIEAIKQVFEWADNWVQGETTIPEMPRDKLTDAEKGALLLIDLMGEVK